VRCDLFAVDGGAREALAVLAGRPGFEWAKVTASEIGIRWSEHISERRPDAVVVGTSRSEFGARQETEFRQAAKLAGVTVVVIEDYPGNYQDVEQGAADLLVVESELAASQARARLGVCCPEMILGASLRYDGYRVDAFGLREVCVGMPPPRVLWIGQPETDDDLFTLSVMLPFLSELGIELLFRAHPRDVGYVRGDYRRLFEGQGCVIRNVSSYDISAVLKLRPCLSLTQFSSFAIELGFFGVPMLHVLFPEAGQKRLRSLAGYGVPLVCQAGGSDVITAAKEIDQKLRQSLFNDELRRYRMQCFRAYYDAETSQASRVAINIEQFLSKTTHYRK